MKEVRGHSRVLPRTPFRSRPPAATLLLCRLLVDRRRQDDVDGAAATQPPPRRKRSHRIENRPCSAVFHWMQNQLVAFALSGEFPRARTCVHCTCTVRLYCMLPYGAPVDWPRADHKPQAAPETYTPCTPVLETDLKDPTRSRPLARLCMWSLLSQES